MKMIDNKKRVDQNGLAQLFTRGDVFSDKCPSRSVLNHVTSRWGVLVLVALKDGRTHRFSELCRTITGISEKMLAQTLQNLVQDGFVLRTAYPVVPPHVEYSLTPLGMGVSERMVELAAWVEDNIHHIMSIKASAD